jgi:hypothetical protein
MPNEHAQVKPLATYLTNNTNDVVILFVHGIGDTCPGYALDDNAGWLNKGMYTAIGLRPVSSTVSQNYRDLAYPPSDNGEIGASYYTLARRQFVLKGDRVNGRRIYAYEFTWSGLTRWVKNKQLGFDLTSPISPAQPCVDPVKELNTEQHRVWINRLLKEGLMDRNLSDAVIYMGSYGTKINRVMADVFCRVLTDAPGHDSLNAGACDWSDAVTKAAKATSDRTIVVVSHSLGSRIVYDTLLEMRGGTPPRGSSSFDKDQLPNAHQRKVVADEIVQQNSVAYMMANQIPLIGLAYLNPKYQPCDVPSAPLTTDAVHHSKKIDACKRVEDAQIEGVTLKNPVCVQFSIICAHNGTPMDVVAFSDSNDLLTWKVPKSYAEENTQLNFTNVYVHNSFAYLWLFEYPGTAHTNYFVNPIVRKVILCGASGDSVNACSNTK